MRVLDGVNALSFAGFGWESFAWVRCTGFADGGLPMGSIPDSARVMGDLMGRHFGWVVDFFLGWWGRGRGTPGHDCRDVFADDASSKQPLVFMFILYIAQWKFRCSHAKGHRERWPRSSMPWQTRALFGLRQPVDLARIEDGEGAAAPRSVTDSTEQWV